MYLPGCTFSSKSDFGSIAPSLLTEHSSASARGLQDYRGYSHPEPGQQHRPPWRWSLQQENRPNTSAPPVEAVHHEYQGLASSPETLFTAGKEGFLYGGSVYSASGPRFLAGDARRFPGRFPAFNPDSQLLFPAGRSRVLPPVFDQFFDYADRGLDPNAQVTHGSQQQKDADGVEWMSCRTEERSKVKAESEAPQAGREDEEDAPLSSSSAGDCSHGPTEPCVRRNKRCPYSRLQITELEREFLFNIYINKDRRMQLSRLLRLTDRQVKIWFQNRRMKEKKLRRETLLYHAGYHLF
ncbi:homeobox protein Hox-D11b-like [Centropristis striata]|uniref:homeobox protein Hox-D11b-like n=1 Tax=Centropristis striata TaxID=184440 RepID=UPI0027DF4D49|nr:homeobox protein Hox-D11b-like [Centropristis striata]